MDSNGKYFKSSPPDFNWFTSTILSVTSVDPTDKFMRKSGHLSQCNSSEGKLTSLRDFRNKPIILLVDEPDRLSSVMKNSKYTSLIPFKSIQTYKNLSEGFIADIMKKSVNICISKQSIKNQKYMDFIREVIQMKQDELGKENYVAASVLRMKAFLLDDLMSLPSELKGLFPVALTRESIENLAELVEGRPEAALESVENVLKEIDFGPRQLIMFRLRFPGVDNENYMTKAYNAIIEIFEDPGSVLRQQFLLLLHIPNVEVLRSECNIKRYEVSIEIQPNNIEDYLHFLELYHSGKVQLLVQDNLLVNSQTFIGYIETQINFESAKHVLKWYHPEMLKQHAHFFQKLVEQNKLVDFINLLREKPTSDKEPEKKAHSLVTSCATKIYEAFLNRSDLSPFQYLRYLKKAGCPDLLTQIRTSDGYNALHLAVKQESDDFMKMLFYANKWGFLRKDIVKPINVRRELRHVGYTPRRLAEALSFTDTGFQTLKIFDNYDRDIQSMPPLHKACLMGSIAFVSTMIEIRPYLMEEKDEYKANCLFYACASGSEKLVEYLLRKGVPRNVENIIGETPLHIAAMFGHLEVLNILSNHFFEICGKLNKQGYNAMYYCSRFGDVDTLKHYKEKGFKIDAKALTIAAKYQQNEVFDFILRETDDVNQGRDEEGRLALHYVVINGNVHAVNELIQKKADITLTDQYNRNVFHLAAEYGQRGVMEILIDEAKKINNLEQLISTKDIFTGRKLSVVVRGKDRGRNAWHWLELKRLYVISFNRAMKSGRVDVARYGKILKSGFGTYPDNECQEMMKKRLADIANEQRNDMTPLLVAVINDNTDLVKILLNNGASPDDQDYKGTTAMHYAAMNNNIYTMHLLSIAGGSLDVKTADGQTPYDIAKDTESSEAINFFCNARQPTQLAKEINSREQKNFTRIDLGRSMLHKYQNLMDSLSTCEDKLSLLNLEEKRNDGMDIRMHIIDLLRLLILGINDLLVKVDSGPVQEVSET